MNRTRILELAGQLVLASVTGNDEEADKIFSDIADLIRTPNSENAFRKRLMRLFKIQRQGDFKNAKII